MANRFKNFCDMNGATVELGEYACYMANAEFAAKFPGVKGKRYDSSGMKIGRAPDGSYLPVTRQIEYKARPSKHVCDARCLNASGRQMKCECSCLGKNHGVGSGYSCEAA